MKETLKDWLVAGALFLVALGFRVPFRSEYAYHWDSAQFALAIEHYDLRLGLPHPPGFFLYVMLGRFVNLLVGDPHASLVWMSVVAGSALVSLGYLLGAALWSRQHGLMAAVILSTSPLTWFHSEIAITTIVDAALVTGTALVCWQSIRTGGGWRSALALGVLLSVVAGTRGQTSPGLLPLWVYTFYRVRQRRWLKLCLAVATAAVLALLWLTPMVHASGGWATYLNLVLAKSRFDRPLMVWGGGVASLMSSVWIASGANALGLLVAGPLMLAEGFHWLKNVRRCGWSERTMFLAVWIVPMAIFGVLGMYTFMPGHVLNYFPALALVAAAGVLRACTRLRLNWLVAAVTVACTNAGLFLTDPPILQKEWQRLAMTAPEIRRHDRQLAAWFQSIRENYRPDQVEICHVGEWFLWGFRHFQYHLPEYDNWLLTPDRALAAPWNLRLWRAQSRRVEFPEKFQLREGRQVLLFVPPGQKLAAFEKYFDLSEARELPGSASSIFLVPATAIRL